MDIQADLSAHAERQQRILSTFDSESEDKSRVNYTLLRDENNKAGMNAKTARKDKNKSQEAISSTIERRRSILLKDLEKDEKVHQQIKGQFDKVNELKQELRSRDNTVIRLRDEMEKMRRINEQNRSLRSQMQIIQEQAHNNESEMQDRIFALGDQVKSSKEAEQKIRHNLESIQRARLESERLFNVEMTANVAKIAGLESIREQLEKSNSKYQKLVQEKSDMLSEAEAKSARQATVKDEEICKLHAQLRLLKVTLSEERNRTSDIVGERDRALAKVTQLESLSQRSDAELESLTTSKREHDEIARTYHSRMAALQDEKRALEAEAARASRLEQQLTELGAARATTARVQGERDASLLRAEAAERKCEYTEKKLSDSNNRINDMEERTVILNKQLDDCKAETHEAICNLKVVQQQCEITEKGWRESQKAIEHLRQQCKNLTTERECLQQQFTDEQSRTKDLEITINILKEKVAVGNRDLTDTLARAEKRESQLEIVNQIIDSARICWARLKASVQNRLDKYDDIEQFPEWPSIPDQSTEISVSLESKAANMFAGLHSWVESLCSKIERAVETSVSNETERQYLASRLETVIANQQYEREELIKTHSASLKHTQEELQSRVARSTEAMRRHAESLEERVRVAERNAAILAGEKEDLIIAKREAEQLSSEHISKERQRNCEAKQYTQVLLPLAARYQELKLYVNLTHHRLRELELIAKEIYSMVQCTAPYTPGLEHINRKTARQRWRIALIAIAAFNRLRKMHLPNHSLYGKPTATAKSMRSLLISTLSDRSSLNFEDWYSSLSNLLNDVLPTSIYSFRRRLERFVRIPAYSIVGQDSSFVNTASAVFALRKVTLTLAERIQEVQISQNKAEMQKEDAEKRVKDVMVKLEEMTSTANKYRDTQSFLEERIASLQRETLQLVPKERYMSAVKRIDELEIIRHKLKEMEDSYRSEHAARKEAVKEIDVLRRELISMRSFRRKFSDTAHDSLLDAIVLRDNPSLLQGFENHSNLKIEPNESNIDDDSIDQLVADTEAELNNSRDDVKLKETAAQLSMSVSNTWHTK